jgi:hypothetical protein
MSPVKYELGSYIPEDDFIHSHCRENIKPYTDLYISCTLYVVTGLRINEYSSMKYLQILIQTKYLVLMCL